MHRLLGSLAFLTALAACQDEPAPRVPAEVRAAVVRQMAEVGIDAAQVDQAQGLFTPVELTPQAQPDWLVDFKALPSGQLCGTGGCPLQVWVKLDQAPQAPQIPYTLAFDRPVLAFEAAHHDNGRRWLAVELHGVLCGGTGSDACHYNFEWRGNADDPEGHFIAASIWGKPAHYAGPLVQPLPARAPAGAVAEAGEAYRAACLAAGGVAELNEAHTRLPDLNGDGQPEWLFDGSQAGCLRDDQSVTIPQAGQSRLFTRKGHPDWQTAWSGEAFAYTLDFSPPVPRLLIRPADCEANCPEQVLAWQDAAHAFVPVPVAPGSSPPAP